MANVIIPVQLEKNLALEDGSTEGGYPIVRALQFDQSDVTNLYSISGEELKFKFQEHGVAYNETEATDCLVETTIQLQPGADGPGFTLKVDLSPVEMWGINFVGKVLVKHENGEERVIYLPGTRTYDPAGITGDPHASERIGPSCSRSQIGISITEIVATFKGANQDQIDNLHEKARLIVKRYHGREVLFDWMKVQVVEAIYKNTDVTPYPEYIKALIRDEKFELDKVSRQHTRDYLGSYNQGSAHPPVHYYQKVAKKDKVEELLKGEELTMFKEIIQ